MAYQQIEMEVFPLDSEENILSDLEARKRDHKIYITDEAIAKVPFIK